MHSNYKPTYAALLAVLLTHNSHADSNKHFFNIPAQPLNQALLAFGKQSGQQLMYSTAVADHLRSRPVQGQFTASEAVNLLLAAAPLQAVPTREGTLTLQSKAIMVATNETEPQATTLPTVEVTGKAEGYDIDSIDPYNPSYHRTRASTATKTDTPIMETPYSVAVVPQQVLKDQQMIRVEDAITNVAGVQSSWTNGGQSDVFMMRGFQNTNLYRDGFLMPSALGGGTAKRETANLDRIEVLKGPGSILFGRNEPGGVINLVTKRPQATPYHALQQQFGSYGLYRTLADSTGAITDHDNLLYRVNLSYENADSFRDFVKTDSVFFAPSLTWNISDQTQANLDIEYQHFDNRSDSGIPPIGNRPAPVPINRQIGDLLNNKNVGDRTYIGANWSHAFNDDWKLSHRFGTEFLDKAVDFTFFFGKPDAAGNLWNTDSNWSSNPDGSSGTRGFNNGITHQQNYYTTLNLTGKFDTALLKHNTLWGFDYFVIDNQGKTACCAAYPENTNFNIFNPVYLTARPDNVFTPDAEFTQNWYGLYFQDQIKFPFNIYGNVGLRYDNASSRNKTSGVASTDDRVSPRGGLLWKPKEWLSVYGNYSENFGPSNSMWNSPNQAVLPPQTAQQWELGAKTEFFDGRMSAGFAYFDLTRQNMAVTDPVDVTLQRAIGEQESRGYEFEVAGEILPGWRIISAYTHLAYANINRDVDWTGGSGDTGHRMFNTPRNYGRLWNTYEFQSGQLRGFKFGGGVIAADQSQGTNQNDFQLPGYATLNLLASYEMKVASSKVTLQLNANNILDKTYYTGTNTGSMIGIAVPRTFLGSIKVEF